jgi:hypothetical protein
MINYLISLNKFLSFLDFIVKKIYYYEDNSSDMILLDQIHL